MLHYLSTLQHVPPIKLFFASRYRNGLCYDEEFIALQEKYSWFKYFPILSQPDPTWQGLTGRLNGSLIKRWLENLTNSQFYFCASAEMMDTIMRDLMQHGINQHQFHFENFAVSSGNVGEGSFTINVEGYGDVVYEKVATIFQALENQNYPIQGDCRIAQCGLCQNETQQRQCKMDYTTRCPVQ
jgi:ferredoxin-NADP reductase